MQAEPPQGGDRQVSQRAHQGPVQRAGDAQARASRTTGSSQGLRDRDAQAARRAVEAIRSGRAKRIATSTRSTPTRSGSRAIARTRWRRWDADDEVRTARAARSCSRAVTATQEVTPPPAAAAPRGRADRGRPKSGAEGLRADRSRRRAQADLVRRALDPRGHARSPTRRTSKLNSAKSAEVDRLTREQYMTDAVDDFITALARRSVQRQGDLRPRRRVRDDRPQAVLDQPADAPAPDAPAPEQEAPRSSRTIDKLLGRKQALDPDFADMRRDKRFRELIAKMCEGTNDAELRLRRPSNRPQAVRTRSTGVA